jgi:Icc-related predicted phosphoesterase
VEQLNPLISVFGHIHGGYGVMSNERSFYINASTCNEAYQPINKPIIIDIHEKNGEIKSFYSDSNYEHLLKQIQSIPLLTK